MPPEVINYVYLSYDGIVLDKPVNNIDRAKKKHEIS